MGAEGSWKWLGSCHPVGDFVWFPNQPDGGLEDNCLDLNYNFGYLASDALCAQGAVKKGIFIFRSWLFDCEVVAIPLC